MKRSRKHQATVCLVALAGAMVTAPLAEARDTVLNGGHYGLAVSYDRVDGWHVYINEYETGKQLPAHRTICRIGESALGQRSELEKISECVTATQQDRGQQRPPLQVFK